MDIQKMQELFHPTYENLKERCLSQRPIGIVGRPGTYPDMHSPLYSINFIYTAPSC